EEADRMVLEEGDRLALLVRLRARAEQSAAAGRDRQDAARRVAVVVGDDLVADLQESGVLGQLAEDLVGHAEVAAGDAQRPGRDLERRLRLADPLDEDEARPRERVGIPGRLAAELRVGEHDLVDGRGRDGARVAAVERAADRDAADDSRQLAGRWADEA